MFDRINNLILFPALLIIATFSYGCGERTVQPFENLEGYYSVYGALEVGSGNNYIRIRRLDTPLLADSSEFEGVVTFENLDSGTETELNPTIAEFNGNFTHNFAVPELIQAGTPYRVSIDDGEGNITSSVANTPQSTQSIYSPNSNVSCETPVRIVLSNFIDPEKVIFEIGFRHEGRMNWDRINLFRDEINYNYTSNSVSLELSPKNFLVEVFTPPLPDNPYLDPFSLNPSVRCFQVDQRVVHVRYYHLSREWSEALPATNLPPLNIETEVVENGLGFFGSYYTDVFQIPFSVGNF